MARLIGLTGGIACGKSTVSEILKERGAIIIDADLITKKINNEKSTINEIVRVFGNKVLDEFGFINTKVLGDMVFSDMKAKKQLENITHKKILKEINNLIKNYEETTNTVILDAPLLYECKLDKTIAFDEIWVVYTPLDIQMKRLMKRNKLTRLQAINRINSQMALSIKRSLADKVIDNSKDKKDLYEIIDNLL